MVITTFWFWFLGTGGYGVASPKWREDWTCLVWSSFGIWLPPSVVVSFILFDSSSMHVNHPLKISRRDWPFLLRHLNYFYREYVYPKQENERILTVGAN